MRYAFTFRNTNPDTAPVAPAHGSAGTMTRPRKIAYSQSMFPASHQAPYPNQPQTCQNRKSPARITERAIPSTKHTPRLTTLIRRIVRRRRRCQCVGEFRDPHPAAETAYADPTHLFYQILIARLHLSVALSRLCSTQQLQKISRCF